MSLRPSAFATLFAVAAVTFSCSSSTTTPTTETPAATVEVKNNVFAPATVEIKAGQTVEWVWKQGTHDVVSGDGPTCKDDGKFARSPLQASGTYKMKFDKAGTYPYFCEPHCGPEKMYGTIVVK